LRGKEFFIIFSFLIQTLTKYREEIGVTAYEIFIFFLSRMNAAEACFILVARNYNDRSAADQHTILRSWAVRDFAPNVPQYIQIFRPENKMHVAFAGKRCSADECLVH